MIWFEIWGSVAFYYEVHCLMHFYAVPLLLQAQFFSFSEFYIYHMEILFSLGIFCDSSLSYVLSLVWSFCCNMKSLFCSYKICSTDRLTAGRLGMSSHLIFSFFTSLILLVFCSTIDCTL